LFIFSGGFLLFEVSRGERKKEESPLKKGE
jgi:hypothetical protein